MKRIAYILVLLLPLANQAQPSRAYSALGFKSGFNLSDVVFFQSTGLFPQIETAYLPGISGGVVFKHIVDKKPFRGMQVELNFSQRGWQETSDSVQNFYTRKLNYIETPVMSHFELFGEKKFNLIIHAGVNFSYKSSEKETFGDTAVARAYYGKKTHRNFDYGLNFGLGANFNIGESSVQLEARIYRALSDLFVANEEYSVAANQVIELSLAYFFWKKNYD